MHHDDIDARGVLVALATPFDADEDLDERAVRTMVGELIDDGVRGLYILGNNGEFYAMSREERARMTEIVLDEVAGRIPVVVGVGAVTTRETVTLAHDAQERGAQALSVIAPYFSQASQEQLEEHFTAVAGETDRPLFLYNLPSRSRVNLEPDLVERLAQVDGIAAVKDSAGSLSQLLELCQRTADMDFDVYCGHDPLILAGLRAGAVGAVSAIANIYPRTLSSIYSHFAAGDVEQAQVAQEAILPLAALTARANGTSVLRAALNARLELSGQAGLSALESGIGDPRRPFDRIPAEVLHAVRLQVAADFGNGMEAGRCVSSAVPAAVP